MKQTTIVTNCYLMMCYPYLSNPPLISEDGMVERILYQCFCELVSLVRMAKTFNVSSMLKLSANNKPNIKKLSMQNALYDVFPPALEVTATRLESPTKMWLKQVEEEQGNQRLGWWETKEKYLDRKLWRGLTRGVIGAGIPFPPLYWLWCRTPIGTN